MADKHAPDSDVASRMPPGPPGGMPGGRAALAAGSLPKPHLGPQGDEQRDPPAGSPAPVTPAPIVGREVTAMDDIKGLPSATQGEAAPPSPSPRSVGPESEVRGGPQAPPDDDALDRTTPRQQSP